LFFILKEEKEKVGRGGGKGREAVARPSPTRDAAHSEKGGRNGMG